MLEGREVRKGAGEVIGVEPNHFEDHVGDEDDTIEKAGAFELVVEPEGTEHGGGDGGKDRIGEEVEGKGDMFEGGEGGGKPGSSPNTPAELAKKLTREIASLRLARMGQGSKGLLSRLTDWREESPKKKFNEGMPEKRLPWRRA